MSLSVKSIGFAPSFGNIETKKNSPVNNIAVEAVAAGTAGAGLGYWNYKNSAVAGNEKFVDKIFEGVTNIKNHIVNTTVKSSNEAVSNSVKQELAKMILEEGQDFDKEGAAAFKKITAAGLPEEMKGIVPKEFENLFASTLNKTKKYWEPVLDKVNKVVKDFDPEIKEYSELENKIHGLRKEKCALTETINVELEQINDKLNKGLSIPEDLQETVANPEHAKNKRLEALKNEIDIEKAKQKALSTSESTTKKVSTAVDDVLKDTDSFIKNIQKSVKKQFGKAKLSHAGLGAAAALSIYSGARYIADQSKK